jgi:hypothetical protein
MNAEERTTPGITTIDAQHFQYLARSEVYHRIIVDQLCDRESFLSSSTQIAHDLHVFTI